LATVSGIGVGAGVGVGVGAVVGVGVAIGADWPARKYAEFAEGVAVTSGVGPLKVTDGPRGTLARYSVAKLEGGGSGVPEGSGGR